MKRLVLMALLSGCAPAIADDVRYTTIHITTTTNYIVTTNDLVECRLKIAEQMLDNRFHASSIQETIDAVRLLNERVLAISESVGIEWVKKD